MRKSNQKMDFKPYFFMVHYGHNEQRSRVKHLPLSYIDVLPAGEKREISLLNMYEGMKRYGTIKFEDIQYK